MARHLISVLGVVVAGACFPAGAQQPPQAAPPALLPPSITGRPHEPVTPAGAVVAKAAPADRFQTPGYPAETLAALASAREATAWLVRMSKADGRFVAGFDATLQWELPGTDVEQAVACLAVARMARFTGDEKAATAARQAVLALFTLTKLDATDATVRVPTVPAERGNKVAFAALLAMAVCELPNPDAKLMTEAEKLCRYLYTRLREDGSVLCTDAADAVTKSGDPDAARCPGLCFQALMASDRVKPEQWKRDALERGVKHYREVFKSQKSLDPCGTMLPAVCDYALRVKSSAANAFALEMADWLCDQQYTTSDSRNLRWVGGFRPAVSHEPSVVSAPGVQGLAAAVTLTIQLPDADRFSRYRKCTLAGLTYLRTLQFDETNTVHFDRPYRAPLLGGVHSSPSDGVVRSEATGLALLAGLRYLESGGERAE